MTPCIIGPGRPHPTLGYVLRYVDGTMKYAHRLAWEAKHGPIPTRLVIDHLCNTKPCINTDHMEVVTIAENTRRGVQRRLGPCPHGNMWRKDCRDCKAVAWRRWRDAHPEYRWPDRDR